MKVSYATIKVENLDESVRFYTETLGLREVRRFSPYAGMTIVFLQGDGDGMVELIEGMEKSGFGMDSAGALVLLGMEVADMEATARVLQEKGVGFLRGPEDHGGTKIAFIKDPNGVAIELVQHG